MAALDFPVSPSVGDTFTFGGKTWRWDGAKWTLVSSGGGGGSDGFTFITDIEPTATANGQTWYNTATGSSLVWYTDADSSQWVEFSSVGGGGESGTKSWVVRGTAPTQTWANDQALTGNLSVPFVAGHRYLITASLNCLSKSIDNDVVTNQACGCSIKRLNDAGTAWISVRNAFASDPTAGYGVTVTTTAVIDATVTKTEYFHMTTYLTVPGLQFVEGPESGRGPEMVVRDIT